MQREERESNPLQPAQVSFKSIVELIGLADGTSVLSVISRPRAMSTQPRDGVAEFQGGADLAAWTASSSVRRVEAHVATPAWVDRRKGRRGAGEHEAKS